MGMSPIPTRSLPKVIAACLTAIATLASVAMATAPPDANAQSAASGLLRFDIDDLNYQGAFRFERFENDVSRLAWSNARIALSAGGSSLFITSHVHEEAVGEYPIVEPSLATTLEELPVSGPPLQPFVSVLDRAPGGNAQNMDRIGGMYTIDGALIVNAYEYYDAPADNSDTTMALTNAADLANSDAVGWGQMNGAAHAAGWLSPVPAEWQDALSATHISGWSSGMPIKGRASIGPSAFAVNLDASLSEIEAAEPLLDFSLENRLAEDLFNESGTNDLWTHLSGAVYGFIIPGTSTYLTVGRSAGHRSGISYGPSERGKGYHPNDPEDMSPYYWMWDVNDLVAVRAGSKLSHEVAPYDHGPLELPFGELNHDEWMDVGGAAFDPATGRLYVALARVDRVASQHLQPPARDLDLYLRRRRHRG